MLLDDGPGNKGIDFLNESEIRNFGHGVTRNDYHQSLIEGYLFTESANYEFSIGQRDDRTVFWMDLDRDNVFERDGDMGDERLIWGTSTRSIALDEGPYRFAFGHMEHGGQSKFNLLYRKVEPDSVLTAVKPSDPDQSGLWVGEVRVLMLELTPSSSSRVKATMTMVTSPSRTANFAPRQFWIGRLSSP